MKTEPAIHLVTDYWYEVTDEQIREHLARRPIDRLRWLDQARRFTLQLRQAPRTYYRDGVPVETVAPRGHRSP